MSDEWDWITPPEPEWRKRKPKIYRPEWLDDMVAQGYHGGFWGQDTAWGYLGDYWTLQRRFREDVIARDVYGCTLCRGMRNLHLHHRYYLGTKDPDTPSRLAESEDALITMCSACHRFMHGRQGLTIAIHTTFQPWMATNIERCQFCNAPVEYAGLCEPCHLRDRGRKVRRL
jgi:hypothetical protein